MEFWVHSYDYVGMGYAFSNPAHILPSVQLSYSEMNPKVVITQTFDGSRLKKFEIRKPAKIGEERGELVAELRFHLVQVYNEPTHL